MSAQRGYATKAKVPLLLTPKEYMKLPKSSVVPLDCSWHMPNSDRSALAEYLAGPRLPHARRFDLDEIAELEPDKNPLGLTHMIPSKDKFKEECEKIGVTDETHVVLYDTIGVFSSPRGAYTFKVSSSALWLSVITWATDKSPSLTTASLTAMPRSSALADPAAFGHENVSILDGGLPRWIDEGGEVEMGDVGDFGEVEYNVKAQDKGLVRSYEQVVKNSKKSPDEPDAEVVLDHRSLARFSGEAPEPRPGLASGHIPNSLPCPFTSYLEPATDRKPYSSYKSLPELREVLVQAVGGEAKWKELEGTGAGGSCSLVVAG
ncbi:hypothetical protein EHS25_010205 [Saitozyma podzolica]|uniref:Rhodanese domain-containing protein n=1 Tax=Saitozyma podzolica TaxID=1890683 RepID=A0A427YIY0_9TREE|nr:hypothetical protein EHS25_010205 [Saitozyma podzolica]